jgi:demethylspheroidene O-methyltransferase
MARNWRDWRNDLLANPRFQTFAARFPLTRRIAAARGRRAFDLVAGFVYSQILYACVQTRLLEALRHGPRPADALAVEMDLPQEGAERLLLAAAALDLVERRGPAHFGLGPQGAALLGNPGALAMVEHHHLFYADLADPLALLRGQAGETALSRFWAYARAPAPDDIGDESARDYSVLMDRSQALVRQDVLSAYSLARFRVLLDIGGGEGGFIVDALRSAPALEAILFDLPPVARRAQERFTSLELSHRVIAHGGDFKRDPLPQGADAISLVRVLHDHDDEPAQRLLASARQAIAPGGALIVAEPMSHAGAAGPVGDAYFAFYLAAMGSGRPRPPGRIAQMLREAGFRKVRSVPTPRPMLVSIVEGTA